MADICLISMPFDVIGQPSIGLSLLVAAAKDEGLSAKSIYPKFWFAEEIGLKRYAALAKAGGPTDFLGEWIFSHAAFPEFQSKDDSYFRNKLNTDKKILNNYYQILGRTDDIYDNFFKARQLTLPFIERTAEKILKYNPKIIGCSSNYQQHCASLALLRVIKEKNPDIITLLGGANCEASMGQATKRNFPWIDFVVSGEADLLFPELCRKLLEKGRDISIDKLPFGVISNQNCLPQHISGDKNTYRATVNNLNNLPIPDYEDYFEELNNFSFKKNIVPFLLMETSRGCWWAQKKSCTFCGLNGCAHHFRTKTSQRIRKELDLLHQKYKIDRFIVTDNVIHPKYFQSVLPGLAEKNTPPYFLHWEARASLKEEQVKMLADSGARHIQIGIENLDDECLKLLNKGVSAIQNVTILKLAMENGIQIYWNFLYNILGEKDIWYEELAEWLPLIFHLQPPKGAMEVCYVRFSSYYNAPEKYGIELVPLKEYFSIYPLSENEIMDIACYFKDKKQSREKRTSESVGITRVKSIIIKWNKLFENYFSETKQVKLTVCEEKHQSVITDTRPCATERNIILEGLAHYIYGECRIPCTKNILLKNLQRKYFPSIRINELDKTLDYLSEKKLILTLNGKILSLAVREPVRTLITKKEFLTGNVGLTYILDSILQDSLSKKDRKER